MYGYPTNTTPQSFLSTYLPACPFCHTTTPHWIATTGTDGRAYFRCEKCAATISSAAARSATDITYMRIDALGTTCSDTNLLGTEVPTTQLQKMAGCVTPISASTTTGYHKPLSTPSYTPPTTPAYAEPTYTPPTYTPPTHTPMYTPPKRRSEQPWKVFSIVGFAMGFVDLVFSFIPFYNMVFIYLSIASIVLSALGMRSYSTRGKAIAGLVLNIIATVIAFFMILMYMETMGDYYYYF